MGSLASEIALAKNEKEINVLVTGFGPFLENKINPSFLIANALPKHLVLPKLPRINIHAYPQAIEVSYANVIATIPQLLAPAYDLTFNIGMAPSRAFYTLETKAHCWGYEKKDVRNELPNDRYWHDVYNSPAILQPTYDPEDVWRRWKSVLTTEDVRLSDNAGRYLCDYIFYACMLEYWLRDPTGKKPCGFLHVPAPTEEKDIVRGTRIALAAIGAIVGSMTCKRRNDGNMHPPDLYA